MVLNNIRELNQELSGIKIDREKEEQDIIKFQETKNPQVLESVYKNRESTLKIWARNYQYLNNQDDMFGEFCVRFMKSVHSYNRKKGSYNTYLYSTLLNCVRNFVSSKKAKKRRPLNLPPENHNYILSLDYNYFSKDGSENSLKDNIVDSKSVLNNVGDQISFEELLNIMAEGNNDIKGFLRKVSEGSTLTSLLKRSCIKDGEIEINKKQFLCSNNKKFIFNLIKEKEGKQNKFNLLQYNIVNPHKITYKIKFKNNRQLNAYLGCIKKIRKNKNEILKRIGKNNCY